MVSPRSLPTHVLNLTVFLVLFVVYVVALVFKTIVLWLFNQGRRLRASMTSPADRSWADT